MPNSPSEVQIAWRDARDSERGALLFLLRSNGLALVDRDERYDVRHAPLRFYPDLVFCEIKEQTAADVRYIMLDPDGADERSWTRIDGSASPVRDLNGRYLVLDERTVIPYLSFFCSSVVTERGLMPIIETFETPPEADEDEEARATLRALREEAVPPRLLPMVGDTYQVSAAVLFRGAVWKMKFSVGPAGEVSPIASEPAFGFADGEGEETEARTGDQDVDSGPGGVASGVAPAFAPAG